MVKDILAEFPEIQTEPVICLVDVNSYSNPRFQNNGIYLSQIHNFDIIVISKCYTDDETNRAGYLIHWIKQKYALKLQYIRIKNGQLNLDILQLVQSENDLTENKAGLSIISMANKDEEYDQRSYSDPPEILFDVEELQENLNCTDALIRAKGYINTKKGWVLFLAVMNKFSFESATPRGRNEMVTIWKNAD